MKIALLYSSLSQGGGTYQLLQLAKELSKNHEVTVFALTDDTNGVYDWIVKNVKITTLKKRKIRKSGKLYSLLQSYINCYFQTKLVLDNWDSFEVLNPHEWNSHWAAVLLKIQKKCKVVWMCNDVWHIPGYEEKEEKRTLFKFFNATLRWWTDLVITSFIDKIIVLDNRIKHIIQAKYKKDALVVRSGIDIELFKEYHHKDRVNQLYKADPKKVVILCFSIFYPHRRFEDVIEAFNKVLMENKNILLVIAGSTKYDHEYFNKIIEMINMYGIGKYIQIIDRFLSEKEKHALFNSSDIFVFPNERQTWGIAAVEAMATGNAVIVSDGAGVHEVIKSKENGFVYKCGDIEALYNIMKDLINDKSLRKKIGIEARKYVINNLSWENYAKRMEKILKQS